MVKIRIFLAALIIFSLVLPSISAIDLEINKTSHDEVLLLDLNMPATINLDVKNNGLADSFLFYSFFGMGIEPAERIFIDSGETKHVKLTVAPGSNPGTGFSTFDVFVQARDKSEQSVRVTLQMVYLKDAIEVGAEDLDPDSNSMSVYVYNKVNYDFDNVYADFESSFFKFSKSFSLAPHEKKTFTVNLNKNEFNKLLAGFYTLNTKLSYKNATANLDSPIKFVEKDILVTTKKEKGIIVNKKIITKTNEGNVIVNSETTIKKSSISRLFTSFNPEPTIVNREGGKIYYTWAKDLDPGESLEIVVKTNWLIPFIVLLLLVLIIVLAKKFLGNTLSIDKRISFVKARGGEFALKVTLTLRAKKYVEKVSITERLPALVKIYEKFVGEQPSMVDPNKRILKWNFEKLEEGEKRVITYIVYSKVGVLGRFALPPTLALYERNGKIKESTSNKAFFVAEAIGKND